MVDETQVQTTDTTTETTTTADSPSPTDQSSTTDQSGVDLASGVETTDDTASTDQTEDTRTDEERAADEARAELFGAPADDATYEVEGLPEGMEIDADALEAITPVARELGLSNKGLSKVAQVYAEKVLPGVMQRATSQIEQQVIAQRTEWEGEAEKAIQTNGADLKNAAGEVLSFDGKDKGHVLKTAAKALDQLAPAGFREFLKETGLSQHPAMVAFAYQAGRSLAEDTELETAGRQSKPVSRVEKYYGRSSS